MLTGTEKLQETQAAIERVDLHDYPTPSMESAATCQTVGLSPTLRALTLVAGVALLALLIIARCLTPESSGFGTHQQLGLPPCTAVVLMGIPCPACGMTTSWAYTLRGNLREAAYSNAGGMLLAFIAMAFLPASCYFSYSGKASKDGWFSLVLAICLVSALIIALIQWVMRLLY